MRLAMDKLQWFKFSPIDWSMGKIQRCPEETQSRFMRLCCLYWNKECILSKVDAEIEIDEEHLESLIKKRVVKVDGLSIRIDFLNEQFTEIKGSAEEKSILGQKGNLKRWKPDLYAKYESGELSLTDALSIANESLPDSNPIDTQSQIIADKTRKEKSREDNKDLLPDGSVYSFKDFWSLYPKKVAMAKCEAKFARLAPTDKQKIKDTLPFYAKHKEFEGWNHPNPLTYLNGKRWNDEITTIRLSNPSQSNQRMITKYND